MTAESEAKKRPPDKKPSMQELKEAVISLGVAEDLLVAAGANGEDMLPEVHLFYEQVVDIRGQGLLLADRLSRVVRSVNRSEHQEARSSGAGS